MPISRKTYTEEEKQLLKNIGFKIQFFRKKRGMSQLELAEKTQLSYATISHLESTAIYGLSIVAVYRIAKALNVGVEQIFKFD
ncbi:MAG: helix-turn-helix domain-containing protein [Deferribacteraceae bacterium]|jgi:transcriptional regulator with XRE-family HTH domain|nr:helix-turn-helix domain-containing protein [Deferribacteraceae bacterium]